MGNYVLKSGQINFENKDHPGAFACVVIKDGKFHNMKPEHKDMIQAALDCEHEVDAPDEPPIVLEDMFG
jgi:hypothetical protein